MNERSGIPSSPRLPKALTAGSLIGLGVGLIGGALLHGSQGSIGLAVASIIEPLGTLWVNALRMTIIPLVVSQLIVAINSTERQSTIGWLGGGSLVTFVVLLGLAGIFAVVVTPALLAGFPIDPATAATLGEGVPAGASVVGEGLASEPTFTEWLVNLVPSNPVRAAADGEFLPLIIFTVLFALALTRTARDRREVVGRFFRGVADAMFVLVRWILWFTPIGVFALAFSLAARTGLGAASALGYYVVLLSLLLFTFTLVLYPIGVLISGAPLRSFVRGLIPAQAVAISTRSSLASLPSLMDGAERELRLPPAVASFVLPLSVSTFKVHRTISDPVELLFLAHLYGIDLEPAQIATFFVTALILSFSAVGIPSGGYSFKTLPAFLAVGIPIEGVVLLKAVDVIPDIFKTLLNVTGDMTAATILTRVVGGMTPSGRLASS